MKPEEAVTKLIAMGYHVEAVGDRVRWRYGGQGQPDLGRVRPMIATIRAYKDEVRCFLAGKRPSPPERIPLCQECPWYELNPWTHYPDFGAWCVYHMDYLLIENPQCRGFRQGEIPQQRWPETG